MNGKSSYSKGFRQGCGRVWPFVQRRLIRNLPAISKSRLADRRAGSWVLPEIAVPHGSGVTRRSGVLPCDSLGCVEGNVLPRLFRRRMQRSWAILCDEPIAEITDLCTLSAVALGTPVARKEVASELREDPHRWEQEAFVQRCLVLDRHRLIPAWERTGRPSVSVSIATRRPENIDLWTSLVAAQNYRPLQVVVGLHGSRWTAEHKSRISQRFSDADVDLVLLGLGDDATLGDVLNATFERADGEVLVKWDDDDLYSTSHVMDLLRVRHYTRATIVGKAAEFVYLQCADHTIRRDQGPVELFSPTLAGGTLAIDRRDISEVGGWGRLRQGVDADIISRVLRSGGTSYRTAGFGYLMIRRANGASHTWQIDNEELASSASASKAGLATGWAMVDVPEAITKSVARGATDGQ